MAKLYLEMFCLDNEAADLPIESLIILFTHQYCRASTFEVNFILSDRNEVPSFKTVLKGFKFSVASKNEQYCILPVIEFSNLIVSGLCAVARQIVKTTMSAQANHFCKDLLGFRNACLLACNEASVWTKFCEIDIIKCTNDLIKNPTKYIKNNVLCIPGDLLRFEYHMSQPVRSHNVYKLARELAKLNEKVKSSTTIDPLSVEHKFGEGPSMTLSDVILYPCLYIIINFLSKIKLETYLPLTLKWYKNMESTNFMQLINIKLPVNSCEFKAVELENMSLQSLYKSDPKRYKPRNRIYTKQEDIENALKIVETINIILKNPYGHKVHFDWSTVPVEANPEGGALPQSRSKRKCEQLENLAKAVIKLYKPGDIVVDFCSGSGHLGILLAIILPSSKVILVENKQQSLLRAEARIKRLGVRNITLLQTNMDYFDTEFNIGVSLHACGVATDLVINHCLRKNAKFVCCPCCYGSVHDCHHITYPRSGLFRKLLTNRQYLVLGHAADQTHDTENLKTEQGILCMNFIDMDRKLFAEESGYEVCLGKMVPSTCTPKNNMLVGFPRS